MARADPLAKLGKLAKPAVGFACAFARNRHGNLVPMDLGGKVGVGVNGFEAVIDQIEVCGVDQHRGFRSCRTGCAGSSVLGSQVRNAGSWKTSGRFAGVSYPPKFGH